MTVYEALYLMVQSGILFLGLIIYIDSKNTKK